MTASPGMARAALTALGLGQLVNWGVLYYAFAVLLEPVRRDLGVAPWVVTTAFSLALLVSALVAPTVGRWSDRGHARRAMALGGAAAAVLLAVWAAMPTLATLYAVWLGLGVCMASSLYEPAFALVTRAYRSPEERLRALAMVTVFGGLASTVFLPATAAMVAALGWRATVFGLAGVLLLSTFTIVAGVPSTPRGANVSTTVDVDARGPVLRGVRALTVVFGTSSLASAAFIANLVPALAERGVAPTASATLGGLFGLMQLPGRALLLHRGLNVSGDVALAVSLALQALGLLVIAAVSGAPAVSLGVAAFAAGSGLTTLARPFLVQGHFPLAQVGLVNGRVARAQQLTRAAGPALASLAASIAGHSVVLATTGIVLGVLAWRAASRWRAPAR